VSAISCPQCNERGSLGAHGRLFEERGTMPDGGDEVFRCVNCGCGVAIRRRRGRLGTRARMVDPDEWGRMEYCWGRENPLPETEAAPVVDPTAILREFIAAGLSGEHLVHLVAEAAELPAGDVRALLDAV
jgi:hypothetical protein